MKEVFIMRKLVALVMALCLVCGAVGAVAEETKEITLGSMVFDVPAEMEGGVYYEEGGIEAHDYVSEEHGYGLTIGMLALKDVEGHSCLSNNDWLEDDSATTLYWAAQLIVGCEVDMALDVTQSATDYQWNGADVKLFSDPGWVFAVCSHEGTGYFLGFYLMDNTDISQSQLETIALDTAASFHLAEEAAQ